MELLTIVCDGNPEIDNAIDVLAPYIKEHKVLSVRPAVAMGDGIECSVVDESRQAVINCLNHYGFRIVEGGQR
jgi:hypothetical protein